MLTRAILRSLIPALVLSLVCGAAINSPRAQDRSHRPRITQEPRRTDPNSKKGAQPQDVPANDQAPDRGSIFNIDTDLVLLDVMVVDQHNNAVFNLKKEDFSVFEDKIKQVIDNVSGAEAPISFGILIDNSGSMRSKILTVANAARLLINQMRGDDEAFIGTFNSETELSQPFTTNRRELEAALGEMYTSGGTALLDAIIASADYTQEKAHRRRKALIVITDGMEKNSTVKEREVFEAIKEDEVQVYLVGVFDEEMKEGGLFGRSPAKKARELLSRLADDSGGRAFFPKDIGEIPGIAAQISKDLRAQYAISYYPSNEKRDGTFRSIQISVNHPGAPKLIARARRGYYARKSQGQAPVAPPETPKKSRGH
jgi:Ca-activated chloride channel family protein